MLASGVDIGGGDGLDAHAFNVGTGVGTSVLELASVLEGIAGSDSARKFEHARPGELRHSTLDPAAIRAHGWVPAHSLEAGLRATYEYIAKQRAENAE